ncbi:MAG: hypothetical protein PHD76_11465 [Methylacidiphilales bacterium]|nr:hypothetical protein [Candidatus Methylacidiphilales bacterium]
MKTILCFLAATVLFSPGLHAQKTLDWDAGPLPEDQLKTVQFRGWIPGGDGPLNGVVVLIPGRHGDGRGMADDPHWQALATDVRFAILACRFADGDPFAYQGDQGPLCKVINQAVEKLAQDSAHEELRKAPLALWGHSAGSNVSVRYCTYFPERVAAFASIRGTCGPGADMPPGKAEIPIFIATGGKDKPDWVQDALKNYEAGRQKHAVWTLALNPNEGHDIGKSMDVAIPFLRSAIRKRLSLDDTGHGSLQTQGSGQVHLERISFQSGWLGDPKTYDIAVNNDFHGKRHEAVWLPDEDVAKAWQLYLRGN